MTTFVCHMCHKKEHRIYSITFGPLSILVGWCHMCHMYREKHLSLLQDAFRGNAKVNSFSFESGLFFPIHLGSILV